MTAFATAIALQAESVDASSITMTGVVPDDWTQGRTAFGGLAAAMLVSATQQLPGVEGLPVRSVDTAFIGPLPPGPAVVRAELLRRGKYLTHARAELNSVGSPELAATVHVVLGPHRDSAAVVPAPRPDPVPFDSCTPLPYLPGVTPEFTQNLEFHYAGAFPFTGADSATIAGYCRHREPIDGVPALAGLVDAWPGAILTVLDAPAASSSVRWAMQLPDDEPIRAGEWHWYQADTVVAGGGHAIVTAGLWRDDRLVAWSEQLFAVFDKKRPPE